MGAWLPASAVCRGLCAGLDKEETFGIGSLKTSLQRRELLKDVCKKYCCDSYKQSPERSVFLVLHSVLKEFSLDIHGLAG